MKLPLKIFQLILTFVLFMSCGAGSASATVIHPQPGIAASSADGAITIKLVTKKQCYDPDAEFADSAINSPKSVHVRPDNKKYYVNSLEGGETVVYDAATDKKITTISHYLDSSHDGLWSTMSGLYQFTHYPRNDHFMGKPVEATFSHNGRYLWMPYYRRLYDINAQDPSAIAVIDTTTDKIVRLMETGPLPKMVATSCDGKIAIACWGDNTVGVIDALKTPADWYYLDRYVIDFTLPLNYSLTEPVNRDDGSGHALRGTVFTPDCKYLLVSCMSAEYGGGIAVIDLANRRYLGRMIGMMGNIRHMVIKDDYLYLTINRAGYIQRTKLQDFLAAVAKMDDGGWFEDWQTVKVGGGARTLVLSPDGRYAFAACYYDSAIYVVDTQKMVVVTQIAADSFPVGLDISPDGKRLYSTSQGKTYGEGDAVDIYEISYR